MSSIRLTAIEAMLNMITPAMTGEKNAVARHRKSSDVGGPPWIIKMTVLNKAQTLIRKSAMLRLATKIFVTVWSRHDTTTAIRTIALPTIPVREMMSTVVAIATLAP